MQMYEEASSFITLHGYHVSLCTPVELVHQSKHIFYGLQVGGALDVWKGKTFLFDFWLKEKKGFSAQFHTSSPPIFSFPLSLSQFFLFSSVSPFHFAFIFPVCQQNFPVEYVRWDSAPACYPTDITRER